MPHIEVAPCTDPKMLNLALSASASLASQCTTAMVMLTSTCIQDGHGTHLSTAIMNNTGGMKASEARMMVRRLREIADELEQRFARKGDEN